MTREINPNVATWDSAYEFWMKVPNPMVTLFLSTENNVEMVCYLYHQKKDFISVPYEPKDADNLKR